MTQPRRFTFATGLLLLEATAACYVGFAVYVLTSWMLADHVAAAMQPVDWWVLAGARCVRALVLAVVAAAAAYGVNRWLCGWMGLDRATLPRRGAWIVGAIIALGGLIGSASYALTRPFM